MGCVLYSVASDIVYAPQTASLQQPSLCSYTWHTHLHLNLFYRIHARHRPGTKTPCCGAADPRRSPQSRPSPGSAERRRWCGERKRKPYTDRSRRPCSSGSDGLGTTGDENLSRLARALRVPVSECPPVWASKSLLFACCVVCPLGAAPRVSSCIFFSLQRGPEQSTRGP